MTEKLEKRIVVLERQVKVLQRALLNLQGQLLAVSKQNRHLKAQNSITTENVSRLDRRTLRERDLQS